MKGLAMWYLKMISLIGLSFVYFNLISTHIYQIHLMDTPIFLFFISIYFTMFVPLLFWILKTSLIPKT